MSDKIIEDLRDVLTVRKLAREVHLKEAQIMKIDDLTEKYLNAILPTGGMIDY